MSFHRRRAGLTLVAALACLFPLQAGPQDQQGATFRSSVDLVAVDVQVVDRKGDPVVGLSPADFELWIDGKPRRVLSADLVRYAQKDASSAGGAGREAPDSRVFILAIDESSFLNETMKATMQAARRFVGNLQPDDLVGLYVYPFATSALQLTHSRASVQYALDALVGGRERRLGDFNLSPSEIIDLTANDAQALARVAARECPGAAIVTQVCSKLIKEEADSIAGYMEGIASRGMGALSHLLRGLNKLPGRKTVVMVSAGLASSDRLGGRPDVNALLQETGAEAAAANANLYVLHIDESLNQVFSAATPISPKFQGDKSMTYLRDSRAMATGLERVAETAGGQVLHVQGGTADRGFDRVLRETTAYYLLGIETLQADRDGKPHYIRVKTSARGAELQHRTQVVVPKNGR